MSYRRLASSRRAFGGIPPALAQAGTTSAMLATNTQGDPTVVLAADALNAALTGDSAGFESKVKAGIATVATAGAVAACAATGAGAALAPVCGYIGGFVSGKVGSLIFGDGGPSCMQAMAAARDAANARLTPECKDDAFCIREVNTAAQRFAERQYGSCALTDGWSMASSIRADATRLGIALGKGENGIFGFGSPVWQNFVRDRLTSEAGKAILDARMRRWTAAAAAAKKVADAEYDGLVGHCPKPPAIRLPGPTACQKKAASTATQIAAQSYLFAITQGAQGIAETQNNALRAQFLAEVAQDATIATTSNATQRLQATIGQTGLAARSAAILDSEQTTRTRSLIGVGLLAAAALGAVALYQRKASR